MTSNLCGSSVRIVNLHGIWQFTTPIPYRQLAALTVGQLHVAGGVATVTDLHGATHVVEAAGPVLCGPCALVRWRRVLITAVTRHATRALVDLLKRAKDVTDASHHPCRHPKPIDDKTLAVPLFPTDQPMGTPPPADPGTEPALHLTPGPAGRHRPGPRLQQRGARGAALPVTAARLLMVTML